MRSELIDLMEKINETRVFGPPGTGKTTYLTRQITNAAKKHRPSDIMVASFTNTASKELAGRNREMHDYIGTLHSHCYKAIGRPKVVGAEEIKEFNKQFPGFRITGESFNVSLEDKESNLGMGNSSMGDYLLHESQVLRAKLLPRERWKRNVRMFDNSWENFKRAYGVIDFTDMIEKALDIDVAPNEPKIGFFDEAQDFTPLEFKVIRQWAKHMDYIVFSGDDDQLLYSWIGATPDSLLDGEADKRILSQSYRVPRAVQEYAQKWIKQVSKRQEKEYKPRDYEGELIHKNYKLSNPTNLVKSIKEDISEDKEIMILSTCGYMLNPLIKELRKQGIPFHNPYRTRNGMWNPIKLGGSYGSLTNYLKPCSQVFENNKMYTIEELNDWAKYISSKDSLERGAKKKMREQARIIEEKRQQLIDSGDRAMVDMGWFNEEVDIEFIDKVFKDYSFLDKSGDKMEMIKWFENNLLSSKRKQFELPINLYKNNDIKDGNLDIKIKIGTVHSVKGGEADVVYLFPDLSYSAMKEYNKQGVSKDSVIRTMYVGMTRAKEKLVLCDSESTNRVKWQ